MKAAVIYETGAPDVFRYEDLPDPVCPPHGVVIDVAVVSIEGGDTLARAGGSLPRRPHVVGFQCAGIISEVGSAVKDRTVGQAVVTVDPHGSQASKRAVAAMTTWVVPEGLDLERAACVPIAVGTADDCLFEFGRLAAGESVLIHAGAGGVGIAAIQLAKRAGATVISTASSVDKLERLRDLGLDHGIDYVTNDFVTEVRKLTGGRGPNLVVDPVGGPTLAKSIECAAYRGRIITVGGAGRQGPAQNIGGLLIAGNKSLTGVYLGAELAANHRRVHAMIQGHLQQVLDGKLEIVIDRSFPLAEAAAAHAYVESRQAFGRVLLRV